MNAVPLHRSDWTLRAACVGLPPALFSPEEPLAGGDFAARQGAVAAAKAVCFGCPVWRDCLNYALDNKVEDGIWGGLTATERLAPAARPR